MAESSFASGLTQCCRELPVSLQSGQIGLLLNQASVDNRCRLACDVLAPVLNGRLKKLFSPQHGLWGEEQANMIESPHRRYEPLGLPILSLYSETRRPTAEMLDGLDHLVIDLQDVGTRVYTFIWTVLECLHACAEHNIAVTIFDRPNPLGNSVFEGPVLSEDFFSFVGNAAIPMRHGLTIGEMARLFQVEFKIDVDLEVIPLSGWVSDGPGFSVGWPQDVSWVPPSPNMPRLETALLYPGQVMLEGTNLSEGRGTTFPFEVVGAPFLDGYELADRLNANEWPGVLIRPVRFRPTFDKWSGEICEGVRLHVTEPPRVRSFELTVALLQEVARLAGDDFEWLPPPYEYEYNKPPIDILYGSNQLRWSLLLESTETLGRFSYDWWLDRIDGIRLYQ